MVECNTEAKTKPTVAVDLDGVLAKYDYWRGLDHIGDPIPGAQEFIESLLKAGYKVLIYSTRTNLEVNAEEMRKDLSISNGYEYLRDKIEEWWFKNNFPMYQTNDSLDIHTGPGKPIAIAYVDDRAVVCRPQGEGATYDMALREIHALATSAAAQKPCPFTDEQIEAAAEKAHEANKAYCAGTGDDSQPNWPDAPDWQKKSAREGVRAVIANPEITPEESHEGWCRLKRAEGWIYGPNKHVERKEHPCLVEYGRLPAIQRSKDEIFVRIVKAALGL